MADNLYVTVADLVRVLTLPTALKFVERFGGVRVYVPHPSRMEAGHAIAQAIGVEAARQLAEEWQQLDIMVPRCEEPLRRIRDKEMRADRETLSARECALKWETTERHVYRIWAAGETPDDPAAPARKQGQLF